MPNIHRSQITNWKRNKKQPKSLYTGLLKAEEKELTSMGNIESSEKWKTI